METFICHMEIKVKYGVLTSVLHKIPYIGWLYWGLTPL